MANDVKIIISAVDKASAQLSKVNKELGGMEASGKKAGLSMAQIGMAAGAIGAAVGGIIVAGKAVKGLADDFMNYAYQVNQVSTELGTTSEEASKLIQIADDVRIEWSTMETAMRAAIRKALEGRPTLEELIAERRAARHPFRYAP